MVASGVTAYRKTQVQTANPAQLVIQLYDGAIRFLERAVLALDEGDYDRAHTSFIRAQAIIIELQATLNSDAGPIAEQLDTLYSGLYRELVRANVRKDPVPAQQVIGHLRELIDAWRAVARTPVAG